MFPKSRGFLDEHRTVRDLLASHLTPTSNCIDIGAFRGRVLAEIVELAPNGRHIAYEPLPHLSRLLAHRFPSVDVRQAAVANARGETVFTHVRDAPGLSGLRHRWPGEGGPRTETITIRVESLDLDLPPGYVPHFIKVDVEGAERRVFEGAIRTIKRHKPTILFEHGKGGANHYSDGPADVYSLLAIEGGLRIFDLDGFGPYTLSEFEAAYEQNERWNFLARK
jgi:FkbM family methyltransferase